MNDLEKLQVLLPHWIEHHAEHADELRTWAERMHLAGPEDVVERLLAAAAALQQAGNQLSSLLDEVGARTGSSEKGSQGVGSG